MSPEAPKQSVTVRIAGEEYTIRANAEAEYTVACAKFVDSRITEVRSRASSIEPHKAAILAALSVADEYFQAKKQLETVEKHVSKQVTGMLGKIEAEIDQG